MVEPGATEIPGVTPCMAPTWTAKGSPMEPGAYAGVQITCGMVVYPIDAALALGDAPWATISAISSRPLVR